VLEQQVKRQLDQRNGSNRSREREQDPFGALAIDSDSSR
jgi:hypothetical protein